MNYSKKCNLFKRAAAIATLLCSLQVQSYAITVIDASDRQPLVAAAVFNCKGSMIGITDAKGAFDATNPADFPLNIQCLGYEYGEATDNAQTAEMILRAYDLPEANINANSRDVMRIVCFQRHGGTAKYGDTNMNIVVEEYFDYFVPLKDKLKGVKNLKKKRSLEVHNYECHTLKNGTDSLAYNENSDHLIAKVDGSWSASSGVRFTEPDSLQKLESGCDSIYKEYHGTYICNKNPQTFTTELDGMKEYIKPGEKCYTPGVMKIFGLTLDMYNSYDKNIYRTNSSHKYRVQDLIVGSHTFRMDLRGKWFKKALKTKDTIKLNGFSETYPIDFEFYSAEEYKQMTKDKTIPPYRNVVPEYVLPLDPVRQNIVNRCTEIREQQSTADKQSSK